MRPVQPAAWPGRGRAGYLGPPSPGVGGIDVTAGCGAGEQQVLQRKDAQDAAVVVEHDGERLAVPKQAAVALKVGTAAADNSGVLNPKVTISAKVRHGTATRVLPTISHVAVGCSLSGARARLAVQSERASRRV